MKNKADFPGRAPKGFRHPAPMAEKKSAAPGLSKAPPAFAEAMALHRAGRLAKAQEIYVRILATQPDHFDSLHLLGVVHSQRGNYVEAVRQIDAALTINPKAAAALSNRGLALHELKRFGEAVASYDKAIALKPDYAEAFYNRGNVAPQNIEDTLRGLAIGLLLRLQLAFVQIAVDISAGVAHLICPR
jgi:tetratricopeptide (TPR) repeat protein